MPDYIAQRERRAAEHEARRRAAAGLCACGAVASHQLDIEYLDAAGVWSRGTMPRLLCDEHLARFQHPGPLNDNGGHLRVWRMTARRLPLEQQPGHVACHACGAPSAEGTCDRCAYERKPEEPFDPKRERVVQLHLETLRACGISTEKHREVILGRALEMAFNEGADTVKGGW